MSYDQILTALLHTRRTFMGLFILSSLFFCIFPTQMWLIPIMVISLLGFMAFGFWYFYKRTNRPDDETKE